MCGCGGVWLNAWRKPFRWANLICGCDNVGKRHARFMARLYLWLVVSHLDSLGICISAHTHIQKPNVARIPSCRQFSPNSNQQVSLSDFIIRSTHTKWEFKLQTNQIYFRKYSLTYFTYVVNYVMRISRRPVVQPRIYESETIYHLISTILEMEQSSSLFEHVKI